MFTLNCKGRLVLLDKPIIMGIINVTPDSFYSGSRQTAIDDALNAAKKMIDHGAVIIDIGGQSTRPGSEKITADQEINRVIPVLENVHQQLPGAIISIDTYYAKVATAAVMAGASMINDISGGIMDDDMIGAVASLQVPYVCMHIKGTPQNMAEQSNYKDVAAEVLDYFIEKIAVLQDAGINDVIIDPGFGFAKNINQNFVLLKKLSLLRMLGKPILAGLSRKSTIYKTLNIDAANALNGTTVLNTIALMNGANILRVHDVKEASETIKLFTACQAAT